MSALSRRANWHSVVTVDESAKDDLRWFLAILSLARLNDMPLDRFTQTQAPSIEVFMNASDVGLCAVFPRDRELLQVRFDHNELQEIQTFKDGETSDFEINLRELMSAVFAAIT